MSDGNEYSVRTQVQRWCSILFDPGDVVEIRRLPCEGMERELRPRKTWHRAADVPDQVDSLRTDNEQGYNIYAGANPRAKFGLTGNEHVPIARTVFADFDHTSTEMAVRRAQASGMPTPSLVVFTGHGAHLYWRLMKQVEDMATWSGMQKDLIALLGTDKVIHNPERIMRLPGFVNYKEPSGYSHLVSSGRWPWVEWDTLRKIVPVRDEARPRPAPHISVKVWNPDKQADGEHWLAKSLRRVAPGDQSHGRNATGLWLAQQLRDCGLGEGEAEGYLRRYAANVPQPAGDRYSEHEAMKSLQSAYRSQRVRERARALSAGLTRAGRVGLVIGGRVIQ